MLHAVGPLVLFHDCRGGTILVSIQLCEGSRRPKTMGWDGAQGGRFDFNAAEVVDILEPPPDDQLE